MVVPQQPIAALGSFPSLGRTEAAVENIRGHLTGLVQRLDAPQALIPPARLPGLGLGQVVRGKGLLPTLLVLGKKGQEV